MSVFYRLLAPEDTLQSGDQFRFLGLPDEDGWWVECDGFVGHTVGTFSNSRVVFRRPTDEPL